MIDFWRLAAGFKQGDTVQQLIPNGFALSPYVGMVIAVHRGLGKVDVQFPFGNERMSPDEIIKVNPALATFLPPEFDQSYSSYDITKAREKWASRSHLWAQLPPGFYKELARNWSKGASEMMAYNQVWDQFSPMGVEDDLIRSEVQKFYLTGSRLSDLRINQFVHKSAAYWFAENRQYRVSQGEIQSKRPNCPKCGSSMRRTTYKMDKGARMRLFACPKDLFLLKSDAILGPGGEPLGW